MALALPTYMPRWASLLPWTATTWVVVGERVTNDGGKIYQCITAGNTGNAGGPTGVGADIPDPGATAPAAHWMYVGLTAPAWVNGTVYNVGDRVTAGGNIYQATRSPAPTTSTVQPTGTGPGPLQTGDGYVWQFLISATAVLATPSDGQADVGWLPGQYPPAQIMNKIMWGLYRWVLWLKDITNQPLTWLAKQIIDVSSNAGGQTSALEVKGVTSWFAIVAQGRGNGGAGIVAQGPTVAGQSGTGVVGNGGQNGGPGGSFAAVLDDDGVQAAGNGTGSGVQATAGATGSGVDAKGGATSGPGVLAVARGGDSKGVDATGHGTGAGVDAVGGVSGPGVKGTGGTTTGSGGEFTAQAGNQAGSISKGHGSGSAVVGDNSATTGYCFEAKPNSNKAPLALAALAGHPTIGNEGDVYYDITLHKLRVYTGVGADGGWETITSA